MTDDEPARITLSVTRDDARKLITIVDRLREALELDSKMREVTVEDVLDRFDTVAAHHENRAEEAFENDDEKERYSHESVADVIEDEARYWRNRMSEVQSDG